MHKKRHRLYRIFVHFKAMVYINQFEIQWASFIIDYDDNKVINNSKMKKLLSFDQDSLPNKRMTLKYYNLFCHVSENTLDDGFTTLEACLSDCEKAFKILKMNRFCNNFECLKPSLELFLTLKSTYLNLSDFDKVKYLKKLISNLNCSNKIDALPTYYTILSFLLKQNLILVDKKFTTEVIDFVNSLDPNDESLEIIQALPFQF